MSESFIENRKKQIDRTSMNSNELISGFIFALEEEIKAVKASGISSINLSSGRRLAHGPEYWYLFDIQHSFALPPDTPCTLRLGQLSFDITVISFDGNEVIIQSKDELPDTLAQAILENGSTVLMERLIKRLEKEKEKKNILGAKLVPSLNGDQTPKAKKVYDIKAAAFEDSINEEQRNAIKSALKNDVTYIWGPPGTGKTTVIGKIISELYRNDKSVLVVSHTNVAVDGAISQAYKAWCSTRKSGERCPILRIGIPVRNLNEETKIENHVEKLSKELKKEQEKLENKQSIQKLEQSAVDKLIEEKKWVENTRIKEIKELSKEKKSLDLNSDSLEVSKLRKKFNDLEKEYPEYHTLDEIKIAIEKEEKNKNKLQDAVLDLRSRINRGKQYVEECNDELRNHEHYSLLEKKRNKLYSPAFYDRENNKIKDIIKLQESKKQTLEFDIRKIEKEISAYESRGTLGKLFSNTSKYNANLVRVEEIKLDIIDVNSEISRLNVLIEKNNKKKNEALNLDDELESATPKEGKTKLYWMMMLYRAKEKLLELNKELKMINAGHEKSQAKINKEKEKYDQLLLEYRHIKEAEDKYKEKKTQYNEKKEKNNDISIKLSTLLENEISQINSFSTIELSDEEIMIRDITKLFNIAKNDTKDLDLKELEKKQTTCEKKLADIQIKLDDITRRIDEMKLEALMSAKIVGTTLTKTYISDEIRRREFDTVILDEASMASIPALWCAASLAKNSIVIVGDFLQLPPILIANKVSGETITTAGKWLGTDIFTLNSFNEKAHVDENGISDIPSNFIMLNQQYRMEKDIADVANIFYGEYGGLKSDDYSQSRIEKRDEFNNWYNLENSGSPVQAITTENLNAWATGVPRGKNSSRLNILSAALCVNLAIKILEPILDEYKNDDLVREPKVLIIAPYSPHVDLIKKMIDSEFKSKGMQEYKKAAIRVGTVHSFQGNEADIVIFDLVVEDPHWKANLFMPDDSLENSNQQLFTVATTRARFKLFMVGNFKYYRGKAKENTSLFKVMKQLDIEGVKPIDATNLLPNLLDVVDDMVSLDDIEIKDAMACKANIFFDVFIKELQNVKNRIVIFSPFMTENRISKLVPYLISLVNKNKKVYVVTKSIEDQNSNIKRETFMKCIHELESIGVKVIQKGGMHEKLILIDDEIVWNGSLNVLSFNGTTGEIMQRIRSKKYVEAIEKISFINEQIEAVDNNEMKCPVCGGNLFVREGDKGGVYWTCENKDYSRNVGTQYPRNGELRCNSCNGELMFKMVKQPRWVCKENSKHYTQVKFSQLSLPKMASKLTKKEIEEVRDYFLKSNKTHKL